MASYRFTKDQHLRRPAEFRAVYENGLRAGDRCLLVFALPTTGALRVGLSVSKKHGTAPQRSRIKRLLREAFRLSQHDLPAGYDLILIPRPGTAAGLSEYRDSLEKLMRKIAARRVGD